MSNGKVGQSWTYYDFSNLIANQEQEYPFVYNMLSEAEGFYFFLRHPTLEGVPLQHRFAIDLSDKLPCKVLIVYDLPSNA